MPVTKSMDHFIEKAEKRYEFRTTVLFAAYISATGYATSISHSFNDKTAAIAAVLSTVGVCLANEFRRDQRRDDVVFAEAHELRVRLVASQRRRDSQFDV